MVFALGVVSLVVDLVAMLSTFRANQCRIGVGDHGGLGHAGYTTGHAFFQLATPVAVLVSMCDVIWIVQHLANGGPGDESIALDLAAIQTREAATLLILCNR